MLNNPCKVGLLFETSWEVCNKIGGIYTVLSTKAKVLQEKMKDRTIFIGPDVWSENNPSPFFKEYKTLLKKASAKLNLPYSIKIRVGRWNIPGKPIVVLVKFDGIYPHLNSIYGRMWELYGVDSLHAYGDYSEGCAFGIASAIVCSALTEHLNADKKEVIAHFDEWTTGMGLLYLRHISTEIATVFTTHATSIGRSICGNGKPLYDFLHAYNGNQMASELNMESKHSLERQTAHNADCFTTVSDVTAVESAQLLEITPQVVTPNGFDKNFVLKGDKYKIARKKSRKRLLEIASALTGKHYNNDTFIVATSGRNEFRNKGLDMFIDAIDTLRGNLFESERRLVAFILVPAWVNGPDKNLLNKLSGKEDSMPATKYATHCLNNADTDLLMGKLRNINPNLPEDRVDIIFIPCYLNGTDGILNIAYYDVLPGMDATVFPSYYEPWGYTPLESIAFGIPTITTDKAGFGQWIISSFEEGFANCGTVVVNRTDSNYQETKEQIVDAIKQLYFASAANLDIYSHKAVEAANKADWNIFINKYYEAYNVALNRRNIRINNTQI